MNTAGEKTLPQIAFLIGMGRSGTTLLTNMLNSNPEVISTPENEFLLFAHSSFANRDFNSAPTVDAFLNLFDYDYNKVLSIWKPAPEFKSDIAKLQKKNFANVSKLAYLNYPLAEKEKAKVNCIVDKNPVYSLYLDKIYGVYPDAKFIVLVRDFRDNVLSRKKYADGEVSIFGLAVSWNYYYKRIFKFLKKTGATYKIIRYEDLVADSETVLKEISGFLDVSYSEEMLNFQVRSKKMKEHVKDHSSDKAYTKITNMHANLEAAVNVSRVKAYEKELSKEEIAILDYICEDFGKKFGYMDANENPGINFSGRIKTFAYSNFVKLYFAYRALYYRLPVGWRLRFVKKR